jgi:hypothetical protein
MKIKSDKWQVTSDTNRQPVRSETVFSCHPSPATRHRQRGVALVLTLILLSVALVMVLAFLAISGRERGSVTTQTEAATARLAAEAGLAAAEAQIAANILSTTNPYSFGLLVSTNYPPFAYITPADFANLFISPRAPVWLSNTVTHAMENRFYHDLNRNGRDDPNGWVFDPATGTTSFQVGDPEWIGVLARPDMPYGPDNPFIARFSFIALPVGNSLDLNAIHNQARTPNKVMDILNDSYLRNQGVGSWEINLPAFLADLNTNEWESNGSGGVYRYNQPLGFANTGAAFNDAFALIAYRYAGNYNTLASVGGPSGLFTSAIVFPPFQNNIDAYSRGPLQTTTAGISVNPDVTSPWVGADNTNHSFTPGELFDPTKSSAGFVNRLQSAGTINSTYDRYTLYRMLSQLGTDTTPESGKMNLNYDNLDPGSNGVLVAFGGTPSATNFVPWTPLNFFMNAADRMLRAYSTAWFQGNPRSYLQTYYGVTPSGYLDAGGVGVTNLQYYGQTNQIPSFGVNNIPVLISNQFVYTPAVNRLLQFAANMYDATTNNIGVNGNQYDYPSIFRPLFTVTNQSGYHNIFITGYANVTSFGGKNDPQFNLPIDVSDLATTNIQVINQPINVYGVPWIVGAKKGFPNFNELAMDCAFQITRKLEITRPSPNAPLNTYSYYQMFILNVTNQVGVECWNSYANTYTNSVVIYVYDYLKNIVLTNDEGFSANLSLTLLPNPISVASWPGYNPYQPSLSFQIPLATAVTTIPNSIYHFNQGGAPYLTPYLGDIYETNVTGYPQPHWGLIVTNNLRVLMVDTTANRVIDYVELSGPNSARDLTAEILARYDTGSYGNDLWDISTNNQGIPQGLANQVDVSFGNHAPGTATGTWNQTDPTLRENEIDGFRAFFHQSPKYNNIGSQQAIAAANMTNNIQAPYTPTAAVVQHVSWQANDPLVHYLANDLNWANAVRTDGNVTSLTDPSDGDNLGIVNTRYAPWGKLMSAGTDQVDQNQYNLAYKDPLVASSDHWDFPSYKLPTVGWLGRVHRGTPWQTVYLKSTNILAWVQNNTGPITWRDWTGNYNAFDAANAGPVQDWLLFDLFTTAFNDNATHGTLSVNQSADQYDPVGNPTAGLAAWSALFSGVVLPPSNPTNTYTIINPAGSAGVNSALGILVTNINYTRNNFRNTDGLTGVFEHEGDILATPQLTVQSPFLDPAQTGYNNDEMYEWLPQQAMSLLRVGTPRYVIYSYGQALKPAPLPNGVFVGGSLLVTNYQVVSEMATRVVVRLETMRTNVIGNKITVTPPRAVIESFNILPPD